MSAVPGQAVDLIERPFKASNAIQNLRLANLRTLCLWALWDSVVAGRSDDLDYTSRPCSGFLLADNPCTAALSQFVLLIDPRVGLLHTGA
jgi:hypothetical protein